MRCRWTGIAGLCLLVGACWSPPTSVPDAGVSSAVAVDSLAHAGAQVPDLYAVGELRAWAYYREESEIGRSWGRYVGPETLANGVEVHRFETRVELEVPGTGKVRGGGELLVDRSGRIVSGREFSVAAELTFNVSGEEIEIRAGRSRETTRYAPGDGAMGWMATLHEELMLGTRALEAGEAAWRLVSLSGGQPAEWSATVRAPTPEGIVLVETSLGESIRLRAGRIASIEIADEAMVVRELAAASWPSWTIEAPSVLRWSPPADGAFAARDVELAGRAGEPRIHAEVLVGSAAKASAPGVLILGASGSNDRYGFAGPPPVDLGYHEIGDALAREGFVVLRYDEPGYGESENAPLSYLRQLEDARRALRMLLVQAEVDPDRIFIVAHGEGGLRALQIAFERPQDVVGVALLATPGRTQRERTHAAAEKSMASLSGSARDEARKEEQRFIAALTSGQTLSPELEPFAQWIREILDISPTELIERVAVDIYIAQGDKDFEVDPRADHRRLVDAAIRSKRRMKSAIFPSLDHLFKAQAGDSTPESYLQTRPVDARFLAQLAAWMRGVERDDSKKK